MANNYNHNHPNAMAFILLASAKHDQAATRSFRDFSSKDDLSQAIIKHFEDWKTEKERMSAAKAGLPAALDDCLEYTSDELWEFMDDFYGELVCLVKEEGFGDLWIPQTIEWIKETIQIYLRSQYSKKLEPHQGLTDPQVSQMEI